MIRTVVFDMGQVLIRFDPEYFIRRLGIDGQDAYLLMREVFRSVQWAQLDWGSTTDEQAVAEMCAELPPHLHQAAARLVTSWERPIEPIEGMEPLIAELKAAGYGIYLLSNASARQPEYWSDIPCSRYFDGTLISCDAGCIKPEPGIYRAFLRKFRLEPGQCIFVDDVPMNVEGARRCGMQGVVFHGDAGRLRRQLRQAGVNI